MIDRMWLPISIQL